MKNRKWDLLDAWQETNFEHSVQSRWVTFNDLEPVLMARDSSFFKVSEIGKSFESRPIYKVKAGTGGVGVLIWTQMHGNESTGTKAILDLFKWIEQPGPLAALRDEILARCTVTVIPMLNPDGAERYTRVNAQGIDLNRDVIDRKAPESIILQEQLAASEPECCFNLHDQRTIFSVGHPPQTATISFLAPSEDEQRTISQGRIKTMSVISAMLDPLKSIIPGRIGRYTDEFYPTAAGDNFQKMGYSTVLVESGHYPGDYDRKIARKMTFLSLVAGLHQLASKEEIDHKAYFDIPNNEKLYLDVIIKNVSIAENKGDLGIFYKEELRNGEVCFRPTIEKHEDLSQFSADRVMEGGHLVFKTVESAQKWLYFEFN